MKSKVYHIIVLSLAFFSPTWVFAYVFSYEYRGQTLYYNVIDSLSVEVAGCPYSTTDTVKIPDTVVYLDNSYVVSRIGEQAFGLRNEITYISIPSTIVSICKWAFYECSGLQNTEFEGSIAQWCNVDLAYGGDSGYWYPGTSPIQYSRNLIIDGEEINILVIPNGITRIKPFTFEYCNSIVSVEIPSSVDTIDMRAFAFCENMISVSLPNSLHFIGIMAFQDCQSLETVTIPSSISRIDYGTFRNCSSLASITIPSSVTFLGAESFSGCSSLSTISIPTSISEILPSTFAECSSLISLSIPDSVRTIGTRAFFRCNHLSSITIGASVDSIGDYAFAGITNPDTIYIKSANPPSISFYTFHEMPTNVPIKVPCGSLQNYHNAYYWNVFTNMVEDCNEGIIDAEYSRYNIRSENELIIIPDDIREDVAVYSVDGRQIAHTMNHIVIVPNKGVYFVKIGENPAQKVLVL